MHCPSDHQSRLRSRSGHSGGCRSRVPRAGETPHDGRGTLGIRWLRKGGGRPTKKSPCDGCVLRQTSWFPFCALDSSAIDPPVRPLREPSRLVLHPRPSHTVRSQNSTFPEAGPLQVAARLDSTPFLDPKRTTSQACSVRSNQIIRILRSLPSLRVSPLPTF